jgi:hypothetical protein
MQREIKQSRKQQFLTLKFVSSGSGMDSSTSLKCLTTCSKSKTRPTGFVHTLTKLRAQRNATESSLLRLPPEIRNKIWAFAVKVDRILVAPTSYCWAATRYIVTKRGGVVVEDDGAIALRHRRSALGRQCCPVHHLGAFHLPEVCRQVYIETATLAYSSNIFLVGRESLACKN